MRIVVVGAGILGASTAYHLARDGADVAIVDQAHDGQATAAGAGICGARTRACTPCKGPAMLNGRMHGGTSTGPRTAEGLQHIAKARTVHGARSRDT